MNRSEAEKWIRKNVHRENQVGLGGQAGGWFMTEPEEEAYADEIIKALRGN